MKNSFCMSTVRKCSNRFFQLPCIIITLDLTIFISYYSWYDNGDWVRTTISLLRVGILCILHERILCVLQVSYTHGRTHKNVVRNFDINSVWWTVLTTMWAKNTIVIQELKLECIGFFPANLSAGVFAFLTSAGKAVMVRASVMRLSKMPILFHWWLLSSSVV